MRKKKEKVVKEKKEKVPKTRNLNTWTESEYFSRIRSALRKVFTYYKPMQEALRLASRPSQDKTNPRLKTEYQCAHCFKWFKRSDVEIDHKIECGSLKTYEDVVPFIQRLTNEDINNYQILCSGCHLVKGGEYRKSKKKQL